MNENYANRSVEEVLDHHIKYLAACDLEEALLDYNEDSFLINMNGVVKGKEALRAFFRDSMDNCLPKDAKQSVAVKRVHGDMAYIVWNAESRFYHIPFGTDTFVIKNGHIVMQSFAGILEGV